MQLDKKKDDVLGIYNQRIKALVVDYNGEIIENVLIGEVWICSGQSNMEWSVKQSHNPQQEISQANHPMIRLFDVSGHIIASSPQDRLQRPSSWQACSPKAVTNFSAVGYYFGRETNRSKGCIRDSFGSGGINDVVMLAAQFGPQLPD